MKYEVYTGFNPEKVAEYFSRRNWPVDTLPRKKTTLVRVGRGAALECGDGRFDTLEDRTTRGPRVFGGINAVMALITGGNEIGLIKAKELIRKYGVTPGTHSGDHSGCGYADLWIAGKLQHAIYPYQLENDVDRGGLRLGRWLTDLMETLGGKHFRLNGNHKEEAVRLNPFRRLTEAAYDGSRFRVDDWFLADLGIPDEVRWFKIAEVVEKLKPEAARLEIIVP